LSLAGTKDGPL